MPAGGHLSIETAPVEMDEERLTAERLALRPGRYVMLVVADTGTGMDEATKARAFEPFFTTKPKGKGTGLGLATVYGIVDQTGGAIALDTAPGHGTAVRIFLPVTSAIKGSDDKSETPAPIAGGGAETLLLVEDNEDNRTVYRTILEQFGYQVVEARTWGADCIWIIMAAVDDQIAQDLEATALAFGMDVLLEVHDERELERGVSVRVQEPRREGRDVRARLGGGQDSRPAVGDRHDDGIEAQRQSARHGAMMPQPLGDPSRSRSVNGTARPIRDQPRARHRSRSAVSAAAFPSNGAPCSNRTPGYGSPGRRCGPARRSSPQARP